MSRIPDQILGPVPSSIVNQARPQGGGTSRHSEFNVATWLQLPGLATLPVSLLLTYLDGDQQREVAVEHGKVNAQGKIMLSGVARLPHRQRLSDVQVRLRSAVPIRGLIVEELFVQAADPIDDTQRVRA